MESWDGFIFMAAVITAIVLYVRHEQKVRDRIARAYSVGRQQGHYEGWLARANGTPLHSMPPRLQEIGEVTGVGQGWGSGFYDYPDTNELVQSGMLGNVTWEEWQERKLRKLNDEHPISTDKNPVEA